MKLNIGCGRNIIEGWLNVDSRGGNIICDAAFLPFKNHSFDNVLASHVLEHVPNLWKVIQEIHRILQPNGILKVRVPYGIKGFTASPYHVRAFTLNSFENIMDISCGNSLERVHLFNSLGHFLNYRVPFKWHLNKYLKLGTIDENNRVKFPYPLGLREEIVFILQKV